MKKIIILFILMFLIFGCNQQQSKPLSNTSPSVNSSPTTSLNTNQTTDKLCSSFVCGSDGKTYISDCQAQSNGITTFTLGECQSNCTDSDGGINLEIKGSVKLTSSGSSQTETDKCTENSQITEFSCYENQIATITLDCPIGKTCIDGSCVKTDVAPKNDSGCIGPTSPDPKIKNDTFYNNVKYTDTCVDFRGVKDYYCQNGKVTNLNIECPVGYGCNNGSCKYVPPVCSSSVPRNDLTMKGRTIVTRGIYTIFDESDSCIDQGKMRKTFCNSDGSASSEDILCPSGRKCDGGACYQKSLCTAYTDYISIKISDTETNKFYDKCLDSNTTIKYSCYGDIQTSSEIKCKTTEICDSGKCILR